MSGMKKTKVKQVRQKAKTLPDWFRSDKYINREYSWLLFNQRVLEEAANPANPLLERLKFLAIFESNLDEFFMVRVSGLIEQYEGGILEVSPDGLTPHEQLQMIMATALPLRRRAAELWLRELKPTLTEAGIVLHDYSELTPAQVAGLQEVFRNEIFPICTPLLLDPNPSIPFISNRSLNLAVELGDPTLGHKLARVKVPTVVPRLVRIGKRRHEFVLLEDVIQHNLQDLFPGVPILGAHRFRVLRDADIEIRELEAADLVTSIEQTIQLRRFGDPVLLEIDPAMPKEVRSTLTRILKLDADDVFEIEGLLGPDALFSLAAIDRPTLRFPAYQPYLKDTFATSKGLFEAIANEDILLHHPYDSFLPVQEFVRSAARDPQVIGIKQTLYRVGTESPIVEALLEAAGEGKQVAVMVELKARFDESNNLEWARALERAGVHVSYGFPEMKTHCKLCLVVRREQTGIRSYAHIGTGNYNPATSRIYTDLGYFTADPAITQDISELFNFLTGFSRQSEYRKLLVAPLNLREGILQRVEREAEVCRRTGKGRLIFKLNSLVDPEVIDALYVAAEAGVNIDLIVRGSCCLRAGVPGLSDRIRVVSIVGRFLEHSRIFYFANGGRPEALVGSADLMRRNLDRRVEVLVPVENPILIAHLHDEILQVCLKDNVQAWALGPDGQYSRMRPKTGEREFRSQEHLMRNPTSRTLFGR